MKVSLLPALVAAATLAGCVTAPVGPSIPVDASFARVEGGWRPGPGRYEIAYRPMAMADGRLAICGVYATNGVFYRRGMEKIVRGAAVYADGVRVGGGLGGFSRAATPAAIDGAEARCVPVDASSEARDVRVAFGDGSFRD